MPESKVRLFVTDISRESGLDRKTIRKLADMGKINNVHRDYNGWRIFSLEAIEEVRKLAGTDCSR